MHPRLASNDTTLKSDNTHRVISDAPLTAQQWQERFGAQIEGEALPAPDTIGETQGNAD